MNQYRYFQELVSYYNVAKIINAVLQENPKAEVVSILGSSSPSGGQGDALIIFRIQL